MEAGASRSKWEFTCAGALRFSRSSDAVGASVSDTACPSTAGSGTSKGLLLCTLGMVPALLRLFVRHPRAHPKVPPHCADEQGRRRGKRSPSCVPRSVFLPRLLAPSCFPTLTPFLIAADGPLSLVIPQAVRNRVICRPSRMYGAAVYLCSEKWALICLRSLRGPFRSVAREGARYIWWWTGTASKAETPSKRFTGRPYRGASRQLPPCKWRRQLSFARGRCKGIPTGFVWGFAI